LETLLKQILAALFTVAMSAASASAADLSPRTYTKAPAMAAYNNWTGFYLGLNAGGAWSKSNVTTGTILTPAGNYFADTSPGAIAAVGNQNINRSGFTGGLTAGYNWQVDRAVLGVETDFNYFGANGSRTGTGIYPCCVANSFTVSTSESADWLWTLRGRVGVIVTPALLLYGTGGLAVANVKASYLFTDTFAARESATISSTRYGWTAGVGGEYALMKLVDQGRVSSRRSRSRQHDQHESDQRLRRNQRVHPYGQPDLGHRPGRHQLQVRRPGCGQVLIGSRSAPEFFRNSIKAPASSGAFFRRSIAAYPRAAILRDASLARRSSG
jgi:outer membrane immunogenic protein